MSKLDDLLGPSKPNAEGKRAAINRRAAKASVANYHQVHNFLFGAFNPDAKERQEIAEVESGKLSDILGPVNADHNAMERRARGRGSSNKELKRKRDEKGKAK